MKKYGTLSTAVLGLGAGAFVLRWLLYRVAVDGKGLLVRSHPLSIALAALTAAALTLILLALRKQTGSERYEDNYSADALAALGHIALAVGIGVTVLTRQPLMAGYLGTAWKGLGYAAPVCLLAAGAARLGGKKPFFALHVAVCLFFVLHIVNHYQLWSGNPQMQDYVFTLLAGMGLMLFGFYSAAMEVGCGKRRMVLGVGLMTVYLCLAELARSSYPLLYATGALWVLTGLCAWEGVPVPEKE